MTRKLDRPHPPCNPKIIGPPTPTDLARIPLFEGAEEPYLDYVAKKSNVCKLPANKSLACDRAGTSHLYVIVEGYVAIWRPPCFGSEEYTFLAWRGPGQPIGEMRVLGEPRLSTRIDSCGPCELIEIPEKAFSEILNNQPIIYRNIVRLLLKKMRYQGHRSEVIQMNSARRKIAQTLLHLAEERLDTDASLLTKIVIPGPILQDQIAAYAGIDPHTVTIELSKLDNAHVISKSGTRAGTKITILDRVLLEEIAKQD